MLMSFGDHHFRPWFVSWVVLLSTLDLSASMIYNHTWPDIQFPGGLFLMQQDTIVVGNTTYDFFMFSDRDEEHISNMDDLYDFCDLVWNTSLPVDPDSKFQFNETISIAGQYYFYLRRCPTNVRASCSAQAYMVLMNPDGEHLPLGWIPLPDLYVLLIAIWGLLALGWLFFLLLSIKRHVSVHLLIAAYSLTKLASSGYFYYYWSWLSHTGEIPSYGLECSRTLLDAVSEGSFFLIIMLLGAGWGIFRFYLGGDWLTILLLLGGLVLSISLRCIEMNTVFLLVIQLSYVILRVVIIIHTFVAVNRALRLLDDRISQTGQANPPPNAPEYRDIERQRMLLSLKFLLVFWLTFSMLVYFVLLFVQNWAWISFMLYESQNIVFFLCFGLTFRVRSVPVFQRRSDDVNGEGQQFPPSLSLRQRIAQVGLLLWFFFVLLSLTRQTCDYSYE